MFTLTLILKPQTHQNKHTPKKKQEKMKHNSHPHELYVASHMRSENQTLTCFACKLTVFGTCYACTACNFYLHKFCFDLPQSAHFKSHAQHTLGLLYPPKSQGQCDACGESCNGFTYNCTVCNYNVHANCANLLHSDRPKNDLDQYITMFLRHKVSEIKSLRSELESSSMSSTGKKQQNDKEEEEEKEAYMRKMEMEAEIKSLRSELESLSMSSTGKKRQTDKEEEEEKEAYMRKMEMEADLQRRRHNLWLQQLKRASDSIDFMGQIGTSNYTYRYY